MGLVCFLIIVAIVATILFKKKRVIRIANHHLAWTRTEHGATRQYRGSQTIDSEQMVSCAKCGLYIPVSESIRRNEFIFCSEEHTC